MFSRKDNMKDIKIGDTVTLSGYNTPLRVVAICGINKCIYDERYFNFRRYITKRKFKRK